MKKTPMEMHSGKISPLLRIRLYARRGSALMLTIMMIILLSLQVAMISMIAVRGLGEEGVLMSQNIAARQAADTAITRLEQTLHTFLASNTPAAAESTYTQGAAATTTLNASNPDNPGGTDDDPTPISISSWIADRRGDMYHLVGRATTGSVDLVAHRWVRIKPCAGGTLLTLVSDGNQVGVLGALTVAPNGRVMFGAANGKLWTWSEATGLSTILTGEAWPGYYGLDDDNPTISSAEQYGIRVNGDGRFYFGEDATSNSSFWTWSESTGLSTIIGNGLNKMGTNSKEIGINGEIFFGAKDTTAPLWRWKDNGTGAGILSTILPTNVASPGVGNLAVSPLDGRVVFAQHHWGQTTNKVWTWIDTGSGAGKLSTLLTDLYNPSGIKMAPDGRVFFGEYTSTSRFWSWKDNGTAGGDLDVILASASYPGQKYSMDIADDGRVVMAFAGATPRPVLTWKKGVGLSTIAAGNDGGQQGTAMSPSGRAYIGGWRNDFLTWEDNGTAAGKLSTLFSASTTVYNTNVGPDGEVYVGRQSTTSPFWRWKDNGTGAGILSTILPSGVYPGRWKSVKISSTGRVFLGETTTSGSFWTWKNNILSTLVTGAQSPGADSGIVISSDGRVFFGENTTSNARFWTWKENTCD